MAPWSRIRATQVPHLAGRARSARCGMAPRSRMRGPRCHAPQAIAPIAAIGALRSAARRGQERLARGAVGFDAAGCEDGRGDVGEAGIGAGARRSSSPGATTAQASPGVWLPERPLPAPLRVTSPKLSDVTPVRVVAGRSLQRTTRSGSWSTRSPGWCSRTRSTPATAGEPSGSWNVRSPASMRASSSSAAAGSTMPSRSRPRRFRRM